MAAPSGSLGLAQWTPRPQTLAELERKLGELERELAAVGGGGGRNSGSGRLVDEAIEPVAGAECRTRRST